MCAFVYHANISTCYYVYSFFKKLIVMKFEPCSIQCRKYKQIQIGGCTF